MNCRRSEELWSEHLEGALPPSVAKELEEHLATCGGCGALYDTFREVTSHLHAFDVPQMPEDLGFRVLGRLRREHAAAETRDDVHLNSVLPVPRKVVAISWLAAAAVLTFVLLWRPPEMMSGVSRQTTRAAHQVYSFGVRTYHQTERLVEDLNVLRMTVGVAFEDRLDRLNEQLRDLEEVGRRDDEADDSDEQSNDFRHKDRRGVFERATLDTVPPTRSFL